MIIIKSPDDIAKIRHAASIWKKVRSALYDFVDVGVSLKEIDEKAKEIIENNGATCAFYNYGGFPGNICLSVNETIIHGVPSNYCLKDGDSISIDVGVLFDNHFCDAAYTIIVGNASNEAKRISDVCYNSLIEAIKIIKPNVTTTHDIASAIQDYVEANGYQVIRNFTGHGCGNMLHEDPIVPNYRSHFFKKEKLVPGMVICIEPMIMTDSNQYIIDDKNNWSVIAKNKKLTSHWEHMILITDDGYEILTI